MQTTQYIWRNGELIPWADATVHITTHAMHYGSSVFEGIRAYDTPKGPAAFRLTPHLRRLYDSAKIYRMDIPHTLDALVGACKAVVSQNGLKSGYIRPLVFKGAGGIQLAAKCPIETVVFAIPFGAYLGEEGVQQGVDACVSSWARLAPNTMPVLAKAGGNYLSSQLISLEAKRLGFTEGIGLGVDGRVSEGAGENIFFVRDSVLYTPPVSASILGGITRDTVMTMAADRGYETREAAMPREMLYICDELFMVGTAAEITPVRSVDGVQIGEGGRGPVTEQIQRAFFGLFDGSTNDTHGWLEYVE